MLDMSCAQNMTITDLHAVTHRGCCRRTARPRSRPEPIDALSIRAQSPAQLVRFLSGGNQQKVVVAKWLFADARILIFDEPTRGIDVGAEAGDYNLIWDLADKVSGIIVISSDLPELLGICHRIVVFSRGAIVGELRSDEVQRASGPGAGVPRLHRPRLDGRLSGPRSETRQTQHERRRDTHRGRRPQRLRCRSRTASSSSRCAKPAWASRSSSSRSCSRIDVAPYFATADNFLRILGQISINTILAVGMTFVILIGGIDLSVGSVLALATVVGASITVVAGLDPVVSIPSPSWRVSRWVPCAASSTAS